MLLVYIIIFPALPIVLKFLVLFGGIMPLVLWIFGIIPPLIVSILSGLSGVWLICVISKGIIYIIIFDMLSIDAENNIINKVILRAF